MAAMRWRNLSFRTRLAAAFGGLAIALTAAAVLGALSGAESTVRSKSEADFQGSARALKEAFRHRVASFRAEVAASLEDPIFRSQVGRMNEPDSEYGLAEETTSLETDIREIQKVFASADLPLLRRYPVLTILTANGRLIYSRASTDAAGADLSDLAIVQRVLKNDRAEDLWAADDARLKELGLIPGTPPPGGSAAYLVMAQSIRSGSRTLGAVLAGEPAIDDMLTSIGDAIGAELLVRVPTATAPPPPPEITRFEMPLSDSNGQTQIGSILLHKNVERELKEFTTRIRGIFAPLALGALIVVALLTMLLSRRMAKPLKALEEASIRVGAGDLNAHVEIEGDDEFGRLGTAFNSMIEGLKLARTDPLTRAYNRRYLQSYLESEFSPERERTRPLACIFLDLDHFKRINDTYGHAAGDYVLVEFSELIRTRLIRENDVFARYGGEEFMVVLPGQGRARAAEVAERIRRVVETHEFVFEGKKIPVTLSAGVAICNGQEPIESLIKRADEGVYKSKSDGRNRVTVM